MKRAVKWTLGIVGSLVLVAGGFFAWMASRMPPDLALGAPLPAVTFRDLEGKAVDPAAYRGKVLFLDFWRST